MTEARLDQIVKGQPLDSSKPPPEPAPLPHVSSTVEKYIPPIADPLSAAPSSPSQIYLNLLVLEASFRAQYLTLRARRRLHAFFLLVLSLWTFTFAYLLYFKPREDGQGIGGSVYWVVEMAEKVALMGGIVSWILMWATGQWERGVGWPRRWLRTANRGIRGFNLKMVIIRGPWWKELFNHLSFLFPYSSFFPSPGSSYHYVEHRQQQPAQLRHLSPSRDEEAGSSHNQGLVEEDIAPGGDHIKLLLLPKSFSPEFRENWEEYRTDYWEKENERRAHLRQRVKQADRALAKQEAGWLWWVPGYYRGWKKLVDPKPHQHHQGAHKHVERDLKAHRRQLLRSDSSHSRTSSRSTTPNSPEEGEKVLTAERARRGSSTTASVRKKVKSVNSSSGGGSRISPLTRTEGGGSVNGDRPSTPVSDGSGGGSKRNSYTDK